MQPLLIATSSRAEQFIEEIKNGQYPRVEYVDLASQLAAEWIDSGSLRTNPLIDWLEDKTRIDFQLAFLAYQRWRRDRHPLLVSFSERVGIPLMMLLPLGAKHLVIFHHPLSRPKLWVLKLLKLLNRRAQFIAISHAEAHDLLANLGENTPPVSTLHTPIDTLFYKPPSSRPATVPPHFLSMGLSYRDYPTLVKAMKHLPDVNCHIRAGSSWVNRASGLEGGQIPANVTLLPFVPPTELRNVVMQSQFVMVPIRATTQWSAGCTSVQIAQALGKAVITTRLPGLQDYVKENETGLLVPPGDVAGMQTAIQTLWQNPERANRMGQAGRAFMEENFSLEKWSARIQGLMKAQLEKGLMSLALFSWAMWVTPMAIA